jgi:hypothetical protein
MRNMCSFVVFGLQTYGSGLLFYRPGAAGMQYVVKRAGPGLVACRKDRAFGGIEHSKGAQRTFERSERKGFKAI